MTTTARAGLDRRLARVEAAAAVARLVCRTAYALAAGESQGVLDAVVTTRPARAELPGRELEGTAALAAALAEVGAASGAAGALCEQAVTTPYIWVDEDATRASGLWMIIGAAATPAERASPDATWTWGQLAADLVTEDGQWRIERLRIVPSFATAYDRSWVDCAAAGDAVGYTRERLPRLDPPIPPEVVPESTALPADGGLDGLARRVARLEDRWLIENLMSRHEYLHAADRNTEEVETCFATCADVSFEPEDWGVWEGPEAIAGCYVEGAPPSAPGMMIEHATTTGHVVVAGDGRTAKGMWISPGHETLSRPGEVPTPFWSWGRYGIDFVKEDGRWRFWHFHIYTTFRSPFAVDWVTSATAPRVFEFAEGDTPPGMMPPTRSVTGNAPYHPDRAPVLLPWLPEPFETFGETRSYTAP